MNEVKAFIIFLLFISSSWGKTGNDVMKMVDKNNKNLKTMSSEVLMVIKSKQGVRKRNFYGLKKYKNNLTKSLIKFYLPTTVKGTALLTHLKDGQENKLQWMYLPALKATNRISGEKENDSFMGSDFTFSDVAGRQLNQDRHSLVKEDKKYYYVRSIPKKKSDIYSKINLLVSKKIPVPIRAVFYNRKGKKLKTLKNESIKKIGPMYVVDKAVMENHQTGGSTELLVSNIERNISLSDNDVGIKGLQK